MRHINCYHLKPKTSNLYLEICELCTYVVVSRLELSEPRSQSHLPTIGYDNALAVRYPFQTKKNPLKCIAESVINTYIAKVFKMYVHQPRYSKVPNEDLYELRRNPP
jgi:hypothetical protein